MNTSEAAQKTPAAYRYPGSRPFQDTPADRKLFWGRSEEAHELLHLTLAERLVVVFASSGLGKSSLINAGLLEPLRQRDYFPMVGRVNDHKSGPLLTLYRDIEEAIHQAGIEILTVPGGRLEKDYSLICRGSSLARGELSDHCFGKGVPLCLFFREVEFWRGDVLCDPVLVIDQFEELFTLASPAKREQFITELANLVRNRVELHGDAAGASAADELKGPSLKILLSLREDWLGSLEELVPKIPLILSTRFRLEPLRKEQAREAIERPATLDAEEVGAEAFTYAPEAVEAIVDFLAQRRQHGRLVASDEVAPSQLQLICQHLEGLTRKPGHGHVITLADLGGSREKVPEVLSNVLEKVYDDQTTRVARGWRLRAVRRLCEGGLIVNGRRVSRDGAVLQKRFGVTAGELRALADFHLLRAVPRLDSVYYELAHDTLVKPILASRAKRRRRLQRALSGALAALVLVVGAFGALGALAAHADKKRGEALAEMRAMADDPVAVLADALASVHRTGCLAAPGEESCEEIRTAFAEVVEADREIGPPALRDRAECLPEDRADGAAAACAEGERGAQREVRASSNRLRVRHTRQDGDTRRVVYEDEIRVPASELTAVAVHPSGRRIATASDDGTLRLWHRRGGSLTPETRPWKAHAKEVLAVAFDPREERILTSGRDCGLRLWSLQGRELKHPDLADPEVGCLRVNALAWSPDGEREQIAIGGSDGSVRLWNGDRWLPFEGHGKGVRAVAFDARGRRLASASDDGTLRVWDLEGRTLAKFLTENEDNELKTLAWSPDGELIATGGTDKTVLLWHLDRDKPETIGRHDGGVLAMAFHPDGRYLASGGRDGVVRLWDPASGDEVATIADYRRYVNSVAFSGDGTLVSGSFGASVKVLPARVARPRGELASPVVEAHSVSQHDLTAVALSRDGRHLASGSSDSSLRLREWDAEDGGFKRVITPVRGPWGRVEALAFDASSERFAAATADGRFRVWDLEGKKSLDFPSGRAAGGPETAALEFAAGGQILASRAADGSRRFWDVAEISPAAPADVLAAAACRRLESLRGSAGHPESIAQLGDVVRDVCALDRTAGADLTNDSD